MPLTPPTVHDWNHPGYSRSYAHAERGSGWHAAIPSTPGSILAKQRSPLFTLGQQQLAPVAVPMTVAEPVGTYEPWGCPEVGYGSRMYGQHMMEGVSLAQQQTPQKKWNRDVEARWVTPYFQDGEAFGDAYPFVEGYEHADEHQVIEFHPDTSQFLRIDPPIAATNPAYPLHDGGSYSGRLGPYSTFIPRVEKHKRRRRSYGEIVRNYKCGWNGCEKGYGTLNHLNIHVARQKHGQKRTPEEYKEIRKKWKEEEAQRKPKDDHARAAQAQTQPLCPV
ncbi:hypothetical protein V496_07241 [Pseudogymnoascus sp. VKM F-4515 (FW-2607)]|nr:hypothetical protein V496_07241 [Pseudogymnoascus sp. VKM F-4515 (FW-2607)]